MSSCAMKLQPSLEALEGRLLLTARPSYNTGTGFYVVGREIYDANGNQFDVRGFSNTHWWGNTTNTFNAISEFPKTKANAVRAVFGPAIGGLQDSPAKRQQVVEEYIKNGIVPIVEDHGATGSTDPAAFEQVVSRWLDPANVQWLKQDEKYVILNIANEWGPDSTVWRDEYISAVARIRAAGINCLLMIDAGGTGGQDIQSIDNWWQQIENSDPQHNIVFSIHMYGYWVTGDKPGTNYAPGSWGGGMPQDINTELSKAVQMNIPLVAGEFSWQDGDVCYNTSTAMKLFTTYDIGWLAWSWNENSTTAYNMIANGGWQYTSDADLTQFGNLVINDPVYGLKATSKQATVFSTPATPASISTTFLSSDTTTQGSWEGHYGSDGYDILGGQANLPTYATVTPLGQSSWTWASSTTDVRALQKGGTATDRIASCWYSPGQFSVDINLTDGQSHTVSLYALDWDSHSRSERVDVVDPSTGTVLDSRTLSSFNGGTYLTWSLTGHVQLRFTTLGGANAVVGGLFFGIPATPASISTTLLSSDTTTQGSWEGHYGSDGYDIIGGQANLPTYASVTPLGQSSWTWASSTTDVRALQKGGSATDRIASCWYSPAQFSVDINLTDGQSHKVSLYALDWDSHSRSERVDVVDPSTGAVLDSRTLSSFNGGTYLSWSLKGHVQLRFTTLGGANAVVSGLFFG